ncbi:MAG: HAMP domain-containing histidine kinase [Acidobacteria bacterium]|nr:HAMP domain-containing histidine kinase [Acidobacteriota bacterium]
MRISNKIASGYVILILLVVAVFSYQLSLIHQMQTVTRDLGGLNFRSALLSLELLRDLEQVKEFTLKLFATGGDPGYADQLAEMRRGFTLSLEDLNALELSPAENAEVDQLALLWEQSSRRWGDAVAALQNGDSRRAETELGEQIAILDNMQVQCQVLIRASRLAIANQVAVSEAAAQRSQTIALLTALLALLLSIGVSIWIVRSISSPLRRLTEGTHAVAQGEFTYKLDVEGSDELSDLARDFNLMTRKLIELDQMKKDFVSHASHELKTPLASMQETIRLLLDEIPGPLNPQQRQLLELNLQSGGRLSRLIANLLDLSRMEAGVMEYTMERQDITALIRSAIAEFRLPMAERNLRFKVELPETAFGVQCDGNRLIQVLDNLLGNALKFSPAGTTVRLSLRHEMKLPPRMPGSYALRLSGSPHEAGFAMICIADQGPGVPVEEKSRIFEKFHQVRRGGKRPGQGTGLGLAISRTIAEAHNGALWVEDNPAGGSIFCLLLPAETAVSEHAPRASAPI